MTKAGRILPLRESQENLPKVLLEILPLRESQENLPKVLLDWLEHPVVTAGLGFKVAKELYMRGWQSGG